MELRDQIKRQRRELNSDFIEDASLLIAATVSRLYQFNNATNIAAYLSVNGEVDCAELIATAILRKKRIFLPVLRNSSLSFAPLKSAENMRTNRFGILEPVYSPGELADTRQLDIVVAPLVAFDAQCNRIGMGGGFYDRAFAFRKHRGAWRRPLLIGVAYDFQRVDAISPQPWDIPLDAVITEQKIYGLR